MSLSKAELNQDGRFGDVNWKYQLRIFLQGISKKYKKVTNCLASIVFFFFPFNHLFSFFSLQFIVFMVFSFVSCFFNSGKVELSRGLRAVYTKMPLIWKPGYFQRALNVMEKVSQMPGEIKITKDTVSVNYFPYWTLISPLLNNGKKSNKSHALELKCTTHC